MSLKYLLPSDTQCNVQIKMYPNTFKILFLEDHIIETPGLLNLCHQSIIITYIKTPV